MNVCRWLLLLILVSLVAPLHAQQGAGDAALAGVVTDPSEAAVVGATVHIRQLETAYLREVRTGSDGRYRAVGLPVGRYRVEASSAGFADTVREVTLTVGGVISLNLTLAIEGETLQVDVTDVTPVTNPAETGNVHLISERAVADLPLRGRNFVELAQLSPGASQESDRGGLIVAGQRSINSNVAVDGMDFNDSLQGNQRGGNVGVFFFPQLAIREFQVVRDGAGAEVGRTTAGFVNAVTRSGSGVTHADALYLNRNPTLTGKDAFGRTQENRQHQAGAALGGPVVDSRLFYFVAAEQNFLRTPFFVQFDPLPAGVAPLPADVAALQGEQTSTNDTTAVFARADWQPAATQTVTVNYLYSRLRGENFGITSAQTNIAATTNYANTRASHGAKASWQSVLGTALVHEARAQWAVDDRTEEAYVVAPEIRITGFGRLGGAQSRPQFLDTERWQWVDTLTGALGSHQWKAGLDLNISPQFQNRAQQYQGQYQFRSFADYLAGRIQRFQQSIPLTAESGAYEGTQHELALHVSDTWTTRTLTATAGLRWEGQWNPQPPNPNPRFVETTRVPNDLAMWQPRGGLAWNPDGEGRTVVRLSAGLLAARTPSTIFARVFHDNGLNVVGIDSNIDPRILQLVPFPGGFSSVPAGISGIVPRVFGIAQDFRNPRSAQLVATLERALSANWSAWASGMYTRAWSLHRMLDRNLAPPTYDATGMPIFPSARPDPTIGILQINESTARSRYRALLTGVRRRYANGVSLDASYTFAVNRDDDSNERDFSRNLVLDPYNLDAQWGYSKQDIRHAAVVSGLVRLPYGVVLGSILQVRSGLPYTAVIGTDVQNDGNTANDRAIVDGRVVPRNSFRQPAFFNWDLRLLKEVALGGRVRAALSFEVFNVTAAANKNFGADQESVFGTPAAPNANFGIPFEAPSSARYGGPRQAQLGARLTF